MWLSVFNLERLLLLKLSEIFHGVRDGVATAIKILFY